MKVRAWPNGLGWDVGTDAEVLQLDDGLTVHIFTSDNRIKFLFIPDASIDPVSAVERCKREGKFEEKK